VDLFKILALIIWFIYLIFLFIFIPFLCKKLDNFWNFYFYFSVFGKKFGIFLIIVGLILGTWCLIVLLIKGEGTPSFLYPPQKLVKDGPYKYCRNPMTLGAWMIFAGEALIFESLSLFLFLILIGIPMGTLWIIKYEEPFLEKKFKDDYLNYKKTVPRWIPKFFK
jgi:protein-S-isoprenylcysteine O-methyltransferase Ste14